MQDQDQDENPLNGDILQRQAVQRYEHQVAFIFYTWFRGRQLHERVDILTAFSNVLIQITI